MKINKQTIICFGILLIVGCYSSQGQADVSSTMLSEQNQLRDMLADKGTDQAFTHKEWGDREPFSTTLFVKHHHSSKVSSSFILNGIILGNDKSSAIINGQIVGEGNEVEGATIKEIKDSSVVLIDQTGATIVLSLKQ